MSHGDGPPPDVQGPWWRFPPLRNALVAGALALIAFVLERTGVIPAAAARWAYGAAIPLGGYIWAREGIEGLLRHGRVGISMLMVAATGGAGYLGMWDEAAALVVLYGAAEGIEAYTFGKTRGAIRALLDLAPKEALLVDGGETRTVPATSLRPGDRFRVLPGEAVPTDGVIVEGSSSLDESAVTGESVPVDRGPGEKVFAGSINGQAALLVEASAAFADNTLSRIIHLVEEAQEQKGRAQEWMERFGRRYSPAVLVVAVLMVALGPWLLTGGLDRWLVKAVTLLVAAAPCALVISLPITMAAGISGAARRGILIKGGAHLEHLGVASVIAFDKTGTLTRGRPEVVAVTARDGDEAALLRVAAGLERLSAHPLARAIVACAEARGLAPAEATESEALLGSGVQGVVAGRRWRLGNPALFRDGGQALGPLEEPVRAWQGDGCTVVLLGDDQAVVGAIALRDVPRDNAARVVARLRAMGLRPVMLTGDNPRTAARVAADVGIEDARAGLKPEDKVRAVEGLLREGPTLMVGDGVNDAPALATATCGVAMGAAGADAAIEAADVALMADDLDKLEEAIALGRRARRVSRQNIAFSLVVLAVLIPAGVSGAVSVAVAVLAHEASELLAVANGLRAGRLPGS